jgi:hypothetical protein
MAIIKVGTEAFGNGEFKPIPTGLKLRMSVFDFDVAQVRSGDNAGSDQLVITAKVTEDGEFKGREIRYNNIPLYHDKRNAWVLASFAEAVGWKVDKETGDIDVPDSFQGILGTEFVGKVGQRTSPTNGNIFNTINGYAKLGAPTGGGEAPAPKKASWGDV